MACAVNNVTMHNPMRRRQKSSVIIMIVNYHEKRNNYTIVSDFATSDIKLTCSKLNIIITELSLFRYLKNLILRRAFYP